MKSNFLAKAALILVAMGALYTLELNSQAVELSDKLVRLHVVANSDSDFDQSLKLKVRDGVLEYLNLRLKDAENREEAEKIITEEFENLSYVAENVISEEGYDYNVNVSLEKEYFPTTEYDSFSLPSGEYHALRVIIGEGKGHNWWCVVFPAMCTQTEFDEETARELGLTDSEVALIAEPEGGTRIKFRILELITKLREML